MRTPSQSTLFSFVFTAILTSSVGFSTVGDVQLAAAGGPAVQAAVQAALKDLRAQGITGGLEQNLTEPVASPPAVLMVSISKSPLSPEVLKRILDLIDRTGTDRVVSALVANTVGLTPNGQTWPSRQLVTKENQTGNLHGFAIHRGDEEDFAIIFTTAKDIHVYRTNHDGKAVSAAVYDIQTHKITLLNPVEAQSGVNAEFAYWAAFTTLPNVAAN